MYEIHRVYVKSTARIYEIYQSIDTKGANKDYLCTVHCGLATKESQPSGEESNASTSEKCEHEVKSVSSSSSDDSWVDVKIPESPNRNNTSESQERNVAGTCQENNLVIPPPPFVMQNKLWFITFSELSSGNGFDCDT
jgi:hypothetical protein